LQAIDFTGSKNRRKNWEFCNMADKEKPATAKSGGGLCVVLWVARSIKSI
jgi:hypothetical protein